VEGAGGVECTKHWFPPMPKVRGSLAIFELGSEVNFALEPQSPQPLVWSRGSEPLAHYNSST